MKQLYNLIIMLFACGSLLAQNKIAEYEYWFDDDYTTKQFNQTSAAKTFNWQAAIPCQNLNEGIHIFNVRFKDGKGLWSSTVSSYFYKLHYWNDNNSIIAYEYWLDNNYQQHKLETVNPTDKLDLSLQIPFEELATGIYSFNVRFKDKNGKWSSVQSRYFQKLPYISQNRLLAGEYWLNNNAEIKQSIDINNQKTFVLLDSVDISKATKATNTVHFRFKDELGQWSSVVTSEFCRPVEPFFTPITGLSEVTFTNTTKYADKYEWDFGDGNISRQVNPIHTYAEPGAYKVKLTAQNKEFMDSVSHYIEIEGIKKITNNKGGNSGHASFDIYGGGLDENTVVKLIKGSETISTHKVYKKEPGIICATFDLTGKNIGIYDIQISANDRDYTIEKGFEIEEAQQPEAWVELQGNNVFIPGRWQTYTINYGNRGNVDIYGLPIDIVIPSNVDYEFLFDLVSTPCGEPLDILHDSVSVKNETVYGESFTGKLFSFLIPHVEANSSSQLLIRIKAQQQSFSLFTRGSVILNSLYFSKIDEYNDVVLSDEVLGYTLKDKYYIDNACLKSRLIYTMDKFLYNSCAGTSKIKKNNEVLNYNLLISGCINKNINRGMLKSSDWLINIFGSLNDPLICKSKCNNPEIDSDCRYFYKCPTKPEIHQSIPQSSFDPNEILGPSGYGDENYIKKKDVFHYTLYFENDAEKATAPAQEIFLADTLDRTKFDFEKFSFGTFTFRDITVEAIPNVYEFSKDIDMREKGEDIIIRVSATFDKATGIINWYMVALDPLTMGLTESPYLGIVYPNTTPPIGEGNVTYSIGLLPDVKDGSIIENQGHIIFDLNEPIATNVYVNTIDDAKPVSSMESHPATSVTNNFTVSWKGTDKGSGIKSYTIYVREGDGDYSVWESNTTKTSAEFTGEPDKTYYFYCIATDNVGNTENNKSAEISVKILLTGINHEVIEGLKIYPNPVKDILYLESPINAITSCKITNVVGESFYSNSNPNDKLEINIANYPSGIYILKLETSKGLTSYKIIKE